ncbi:MAG: hypothetical protein Kow0062_26150 [Acidobacteriota bacterium]
MTGDGVPTDYERVREALRSRGYLEAPLERLFAGTATGAFGAGWGGLVAAALVAGAVGGLVLGTLLAALLVGHSGGLVPVWPDGVLYAVLFAPVLGLGVAVAELVAGVAVRLLARWRPTLLPRRAALVAGLVAAAAVAVYVGTWWVRSGARPSPGGVLGLLALALAAGFVGRLVAAAALVHAALASGRVPRRPARNAVGLVAVAILVTGATVLASITWSRARERLAEPVRHDPAATSRLVVVGWDGIGRDLADGMARAGDLPWLREELGAGRVFSVLPVEAAHPAGEWTSVATGCPPAVHGVLGAQLASLRGAVAPAPRGGLARGPLALLERLWPTRQRPLRAGLRDRPAVWEITADAARTAVIGWWGTWPATSPGRAGGYVVSDGALAALRTGRAARGAVYPETLATTRATDWLAAADARAAAVVPGQDDRARLAREALVIDLFALAALESVLDDPELGAAFVYLPGIDVLRERWHARGVDALSLLDATRRHARVVGSELERVVLSGQGRLVSVVGLPGRVGLAPGWGTLSGTPEADAVATRLAGEPAGVPATSLAGVWLAVAGFTVDARLCDADPVRLARWIGRPVETRRTAARPAEPGPGDTDLEPELYDRLRSLGYVD